MLSTRIRRGGVVAVAVAITGLVAGCSSAGGPPPASSKGSSALEPTLARSASPESVAPLPSVAPSATASPTAGPSVIPIPLGSASAGPPVVVTMDDPGLSFRLPPRWQSLPASVVRGEAEHAKAAVGPAAQEAYTGLIGLIDAGEIRGGAIGPSGFGAWQGTIVYAVSPAASIDAEIAAIEGLQFAIGNPATRERSEVHLPLGPAVRVEVTADPPAGAGSGSVAARGLAYYVDLGPGGIFWLTATGPADSPTFAGLIGDVMASLARR